MRHYDYPEDEFDAIDDDGPVPVGAHRAQAPAWRSWVPLLAVLIIVPALAWGVVAFLGRTKAPSTGEATQAAPAAPATQAEGNTPAEQPEATPEAPAAPAGDADLTTGVTVHNGTATNGLAGRTGDKLGNAGFTSVTVSPGAYDAVEPTVTTVFYASPEVAPTAHAAAQALGITAVVESAEEAQSNPIVIVLRDDFQE